MRPFIQAVNCLIKLAMSDPQFRIHRPTRAQGIENARPHQHGAGDDGKIPTIACSG